MTSLVEAIDVLSIENGFLTLAQQIATATECPPALGQLAEKCLPFVGLHLTCARALQHRARRRHMGHLAWAKSMPRFSRGGGLLCKKSHPKYHTPSPRKPLSFVEEINFVFPITHPSPRKCPFHVNAVLSAANLKCDPLTLTIFA